MEELVFIKQNGSYVCELSENQRSGVIQIHQVSRGIVSVSANMAGLPPAVVAVFDNPYGNSVLFELDMPTGLAVTIKSATEVKEAVWMQ